MRSTSTDNSKKGTMVGTVSQKSELQLTVELADVAEIVIQVGYTM